MQDAIACAHISQRNAGMRGHAAAIGHGILRTINGGQPGFQKIQTGMAKPRIYMVGFPNQWPGAVKIGLMHIFGMLRRWIDEGGGHENRWFDRPHAHFRVIAKSNRERFGTQPLDVILCHGSQYTHGPCHNNSR